MNLLKTSQLLLTIIIIGIFLPPDCRGEFNLGTNQEENLLFSTAQEVKIGRSLAARIEEKLKICPDPQIQKRIQQIGERLAGICDRKDITYSFIVIEDEKTNAFSLPGGYVYIYQGLIEKANSDDEIAAVLAHELGHIVARHSIKRLQASLGYSILSIISLAATKDPRFKGGTDQAFGQIMLGYSREDELLADQLAVKYLDKAGYNPGACIEVLQLLKQIEKEAPLQPLVASYFRSHPYLSERISAVKQEVYGKIDFGDYLNRLNVQ